MDLQIHVVVLPSMRAAAILSSVWAAIVPPSTRVAANLGFEARVGQETIFFLHLQ
jgi:hypothetical protein